MKQKILFLKLLFYASLILYLIPKSIKWLAQKISPGGLTLPTAHSTNAIVISVILLFVVVVKNYDKFAKQNNPTIKQAISFTLFSLFALSFFLLLHWVRIKSAYFHFGLAWCMYALFCVALFISIFGTKLFLSILKDLLISITALAVYVTALLVLDKQQWVIVIAAKIIHFFAGLITDSVYSLVNGTPHVRIGNFEAGIGAPCSGIFSMVMFTAIFSFVYWLDYKKINTKKAIIWFLAGLVGVYFVNILRVVIILIIASKVNADFAITHLHENAGWLLFLTYSLVYWYICYPKIFKNKKANKKK